MKKQHGLLCAISFLLLNFSEAQMQGNWSLSGPSKFPTDISGQINGMGRVSQIKFHPTNPNKVYAVSATGGLWMSSNSGTIWNFTGTDNLPEHSFASVCIDYTNDSVLYLGGGDANYYGRSLYACWKSVDAGNTWNPSNNGMGNRLVIEMLMSPVDHNVIIAATDDGIFKTYDGGATWNEKLSAGNFTDMAYKPVTGTSTIYAVSYTEILRSKNLGETWDTLTNGVSIPNNDGEGMRLAVTPADTNRVYVAMIANRGNVLRSNDGGDSWTTVKNDYNQSLVGYAVDEDGQGNYDFTLIAHPQNPDWLFLSAHCHWRSLDGGYTWEKLTNWWTNCHTDMHDYEFNPANSDELLNSNDGGVWTSSDTAKHWNAKCDFLNNTEFYHVAQSNLHRGYLNGGTQDNGELYMSYYNWYTNRGGDWTSTITFDFLSSDYCYEIGDGNRRGLTGGEKSMNFPFIPDNSVRMEFTPDAPQLTFASLDNIWRCDTLSSNNFSWSQISNIGVQLMDIRTVVGHPNILYAVDNNKKIYRSDNALDATPIWTTGVTLPNSTNVYAAIASMPNDSNVVYVSCNSKIYRSINKGQNFVSVTANLPNSNIKKIVADRYADDESVYALVGNTVYYKNSTMSNWLNYSYGMPTIAQARDLMIFNNGTANAVLRVSFFGRGVWESPLYSIPVCNPTDSLFVTNITMTAALLHWNASGNGNYFVQYKAMQSPDWTTVNATTNTYLLNGLIANTKYVFRVQSQCNGNLTSGFSLPQNFITDCVPPPAQWVHQDIGQPGIAGDVCYESSTQTFHMKGSGKDIWDYDDEFQYMYQQVHGDVTITAYCVLIEDVYPWSKAGVMIRETLDSNSLHAMMAITPGNGAAFHRRNNNTSYTANYNDTSFHAPVWLRMTRAGNSFTGSVSNDSISWTDVHTSTIGMSDTVYIGLCHTSHIHSTVSESVFRFISFSPDTALIQNPTEITEVGTLKSEISISPNPANNEIAISCSQFAVAKTTLQIFDITGRKIFETTPLTEKFTVNTSKWDSGIYFMRVNSKDRKFVVAH